MGNDAEIYSYELKKLAGFGKDKLIIQRIILKENTKNAFFSQSNMLLYIILLKALIIERKIRYHD